MVVGFTLGNRPKMAESPPTPPAELPAEIERTLAEQSPVVLRAIARYADELADYRDEPASVSRPTPPGDRRDEDRTGQSGQDSDGQSSSQPDEKPAQQSDQQSDDPPDGVPSKATVTVKEINGNRYYYWQWRDGDQIKSKYKGPVNSTD